MGTGSILDSTVDIIKFPLEYAALFKSGLRAHMKFLLVILSLIFTVPAFAGFSTVVIDAGHGGHDRGGIPGQRVAEKGICLDIAFRLRAYLRDAGLRTVMTRSSDTFISLPQRVAVANAQRNAVFVSIHTNSARREGAHGYETYYYQARAAKLAYRVQARLSQVIPTDNRGVKRRGFYVLRKSRTPAVLIESGFLTNRNEARMMLSSAYRQRIAQAIGRAVVESSGR